MHTAAETSPASPQRQPGPLHEFKKTGGKVQPNKTRRGKGCAATVLRLSAWLLMRSGIGVGVSFGVIFDNASGKRGFADGSRRGYFSLLFRTTRHVSGPALYSVDRLLSLTAASPIATPRQIVNRSPSSL